MKKTDLENKIKGLELELSNIKSNGLTTKQGNSGTTKHNPEESSAKFPSLAKYINAFIAYVNADTLRYEFVNDLYLINKYLQQYNK